MKSTSFHTLKFKDIESEIAEKPTFLYSYIHYFLTQFSKKGTLSNSELKI